MFIRNIFFNCLHVEYKDDFTEYDGLIYCLFLSIDAKINWFQYKSNEYE